MHTGQHYDTMLKDSFIQQMGLADIDFPVGISDTLQGLQIGEIMMKMNNILTGWSPDLVIVVEDEFNMQEETTFFGLPSLTLRKNTERTVTIDLGTNELIDLDVGIIEQKIAAK